MRPTALILLTCLIAGCAPHALEPGVLLDLHPGMTISDVHRRLGGAMPHQATAQVESGEIEVEGDLFCPRGELYLVYRDGHLEKIIDATPRLGDRIQTQWGWM